MVWLMLAASGTFGGLSGILLRLAALESIGPTAASWLPLALRGAAVASYGLGFVLYALALRKINLGTAYPLMVAMSILAVLAFTAIHEHALKPMQIVGALVILSGIWLVTRQA
ncbi:EamA family transporter [Paraburkholderia sp. SIMBA_030]|uniref:EamA family transporter n=1 Tax=Paraburkholderia sp. SIMBA_030 TaxID=3085773 RepID=UPI00397C67B7